MHNVTRTELAQVIAQKTLLLSKQDLVNNLAGYITESHGSVNLDDLLRDVMHYRQAHGVIEAVVVSAHELDAQALTDVEALLRERYTDAQKIIINQRIDNGVVGGIRIELPRETLDLTVKAKLNRFKRLTEEKK